ncbi:MAG: hypothetical protein ACSLFP_09925 [Acidimicrobiales bacterium]
MARMRLRQRPSPRLPAGWVRPRWLSDDADGGEGNVGRRRWTTIGSLDSAWRARVDLAGLVQPDGAAWALDWWIGAEDRWHVPAREAAVRQSLIGNSPVVETRLRVPSGDAVHRTYGARSPAGDDVVVVEVENATKVPFAVVVALRPYGVDRLGRLREVSLDGSIVRVDGEVAAVLARPPGRVAVSHGTDDDAAAAVFAGEAAVAGPVAVTCPDGRATLAMVFPLAHTATLRVVLPAPGVEVRGMAGLDVGVVPDAPQVAAGWVTHTRRAARIEVPDRRLREALLASVRHLLLAPPSPPVAAALDLLGLADEAAFGLLDDPQSLARSGSPGAALHAVARHHALTADADFARSAAPVVAALVAALPRARDVADRALGHGALPEAATLLAAAGEPRAAADARHAAQVAARPSPPPPGVDDDPLDPAGWLLQAARRAGAGDGGALDGLDRVLDRASPTWAWPSRVPAAPVDAGTGEGHDPAANAAMVTLLRHLLVQEVAGDTPALALSPVVPEAWLGAGWEVHDLPTAHGEISFAVRWHGERPALLWELRPHPDQDTPVRLTIPGLDPTWRSDERQGEVLLGPVAVPERAPQRRGLSIPVTIEPLPPRPS